MNKIAILGAGLTGVELGRRLKEAGRDFIILEKESQIGGLCRTNKSGDYYWDFAVHALYSHNRQVLDYLRSLPLDYNYLARNAKIFHRDYRNKNTLLDYPFEVGIKDLPLKERLECVYGYLSAALKNTVYSNLEEWIDTSLGRGIARNFMTPYNQKIWNCPLDQISPELVMSKIEPMRVTDFIFNVLGRKTIGRKYQSNFIYPKKGIQELINYTAKSISSKILLDSGVKKLVKEADKWVITTENGKNIQVDTVISTMPLPELLTKVDIDGVDKRYAQLKWNDTFFVMVGLKKGDNFKIIDKCHWVFFKGQEIFYRVTVGHNFSREFLPALVVEITKKDDLANKSHEEILRLVLQDLIRLGIVVSQDQIAQADIKLITHTYPIPTVGLNKIKEEIANKLKENNIYLLGRSGAWDYLNMDGVLDAVKQFCEKEIKTEAGGVR